MMALTLEPILVLSEEANDPVATTYLSKDLTFYRLFTSHVLLNIHLLLHPCKVQITL